MPTALRDMQPWRRALIEAGLTLRDAAEATGKSVDTVEAYSIGRRRPSPEWQLKVLALAAEHLRAA